MNAAIYEITGTPGAWRVTHDGTDSMAYASKEAAFEAAAGAATNAIKQGYEVIVKVQGSRAEEPALGN